MGITVDIDTGGTFTDGFFSRDELWKCVKVDTTPHDLVTCFTECIQDGAKIWDYKNVSEFLRHVDVIRFSTTIGTNSLIQQTGPKIGLMVSAGSGQTPYSGIEPKLFEMAVIGSDRVARIRESVGPDGEIIIPVDEEGVKKALAVLLNSGVEIIVISLINSHINPGHERKVRVLAEAEYPPHYLGSVPIILASQISKSPDEGIRTGTALMDAYFHQDMVKYLYKAEDWLRSYGYNKPLLVVHSTGGACRVAKTRAIDTYNSGPVAGLHGAQHLAKKVGWPNIITFDMGGTSTDVSLIRNGGFSQNPRFDINGVLVDLPLADIKTIGLGGGSIIRVQDKAVQVGPQSAGAVPGPACFGLGGTDFTVTDACVLLGYIDPLYFLGGRRKLYPQLSVDAWNNKVGQHANIVDAGMSARLVKEAVVKQMVNEIKGYLEEPALDAQEFTLLAYGGGGGLFCCDVAKELGISKVLCSKYAPVFSAYGSSHMDMVHSEEKWLGLPLDGSPVYLPFLQQVLAKMEKRVARDLIGKAYDPTNIEIKWMLEMRLKTADGSRICHLTSESSSHEDTFPDDRLAKELEGSLDLETIRLEGRITLPRYLESPALGKYSPGENAHPVTSRDVLWEDVPFPTPVYRMEQLGNNAHIFGPSIVESSETNIVLPRGWKLTVDVSGTLVIECDTSK